MPTSMTAESANSVETRVFRQARVVAIVGRNVAFLLVSLVYLIQSAKTPVGIALFGALLIWSSFRIYTRNDSLLRVGDVGFVVAAGLLAPLIVSPTIIDASMSATRAIGYPMIVAAGVVWATRWSFTVMVVVTGAAAIGDLILFGRLDISLAAFVFSWAAAACVHRLIQRAAASADAAYAEAHRARLREQVAAARIRFEREHFAMLHDTAASTLMMVGDSSGLDAKRLSAQAARDIEVLTTGSEVVDPDWQVDLVDHVEVVSLECRTPVTVTHEGPVMVPSLIASLVSAATREALNNVDRHSGASRTTIDVEPGRVSIVDDGVGFNPDERRGFGLRFSIEGRMRRAGGTGSVSSAPGAGTIVKLMWPVVPPEPAGKPIDVAGVVRGFQYGLAAASFLVNIEMLVIGFGGFTGIRSPITALVISGLFLMSGLAVVVVRFGAERLRWVCITIVVVVALFRIATLPPGLLTAVPNWVAIAVGWVLVALLSGWVASGRRTAIAVGLIFGYWVIRGAIRVWRMPTSEMIEFSGYGIASVATMQAAAIACAWVLAEAVRVAARLGEQRYRIATHRAVEEALQQDYRRHFASLTADIVGLLRGIADGTMPVDRPAVRDRAHIEYARLRRLFAQAESFEHPLMQRLRPLVDAAARRNVDITLDVQSRPPELAPQDLEAVAAAIGHLVEGAQERIRLVVSSSLGHVTVSIVSDSNDAVCAQVRDALADGDYQLTVADRVTWLRVHIPVAVAA
ncbi:ATP-binding protein [Smaragdicoccus niigatensis]|uniref:ATP-binding protein n=1 Tax=Smaragdicoccus niigatensis TaxID=359359 RepID=UPI0003704FD7|nr:ATP-binding protein [Smaragdicoccus niigatensis]